MEQDQISRIECLREVKRRLQAKVVNIETQADLVRLGVHRRHYDGRLDGLHDALDIVTDLLHQPAVKRRRIA